jgi:hypothetical protein
MMDLLQYLMSLNKMFLFLAMIIQMGHDTSDNPVDYWLTAEQFFSPYSKTVGHDMT